MVVGHDKRFTSQRKGSRRRIKLEMSLYSRVVKKEEGFGKFMLRNLHRIVLVNCLFLAVLVNQTTAQDSSQWGSPEGAKVRLGKGRITDEIVESPNGTHLAVPTSIGIWLLETQTYQEIALLAGLGPVAFSPDGNMLASGGDRESYRRGSYREIRLWDVATGEHKGTRSWHWGSVSRLVFSPTGRTLASVNESGRLRLWSTRHTREQKLTENRVGGVAFSPDGRILALGQGAEIRLWDLGTREIRLTIAGGGGNLAFSPDGRTLAGRSGTEIRLWDSETGELKLILTRHTGIKKITFSPDGRTLASGSRDEIRLWDVAIGELKHTLTGEGGGLAFSPDGQTLKSISGKEIRLWDVTKGTLKHSLTWDPDGDWHTGGFESVVFSPDGRTLANASRSEIRLWDVAIGELKRILTGHTDSVMSLAFSPDGRTLASGSRGEIRLWNIVTGTLKHSLTDRGESLAFSLDGSTLFSKSRSEIHVRDTITGQLKYSLKGHSGSVVFSPDGRTLASWGRADLRLLDVVTGEVKHSLTGGRTLSSVAFSPDGRTLASARRNATIRLWDVTTGEVKHTLTGHTSSSIAFRPGGRTLASVGGGEIRLWDVITGEPKDTLTGHPEANKVIFSPEGNTLASVSEDVVFLWKLSPFVNTTVSISPSPVVSPEIGEQLTLSLNIENGESVAGYQVAVNFDATALRYVESVNGDYLPAGSFFVPPVVEANRVILGATAFTGASSSDGTLATLTFEVVDVKESNLILSEVLLTNSEGEPLLSPFIQRGRIEPTTVSSSAIVSFSSSPVASPAIGEQLTLSLNIADAENIAGYQVTVHFDATALRYVESVNGDYLPKGAVVAAPAVGANRLTIGATAFTGASSSDGTLATLTFEVVDVKESNLILSEVLLTNSEGEPLLPRLTKDGQIVEPTAVPSTAIVRIMPSRVPSPAIGGQFVFNVDIIDGQNVTEHQLTWTFDSTALRHISSSQVDYLTNDAGNGDGRLMSGIFEVLVVKPSIVGISGYLTTNGLRSIPTFENAVVIVPLFGDVNRDGAVNILDLILVASSFGQPVPAEGNPADVNEDGVVNIVDLVKAAGALGNTGAAPSAHLETLSMLTTTDVHGWLTQAQGLDLTDATFQRGIIFLEQLLAALTPKETGLLPNYPNPFNPETWIPYHLAHDADVRLTIYDTKGATVRRLDLGHQPAGYYTARIKAAYWDGRNSLGEVVGSGVYFYQLSAGDFFATRKMVILK